MKLLREPLLHFAVAGVILFSGYSWFSERQPDADGLEPVQVGQGEIDWLRQLFQNQWLRPPDTRELKGLVTDLVNEELLAREAEAMGLGEDDGIIRRRLAQKLKFLVEDTTRLAQPTRQRPSQLFRSQPVKICGEPEDFVLPHLFQSGEPDGRDRRCGGGPCRPGNGHERRRGLDNGGRVPSRAGHDACGSAVSFRHVR